MERIATELGDVVAAEIDARDPASGIFALPIDEAIEKVTLGQKLLEEWKARYMAMREKIELSGRDAGGSLTARSSSTERITKPGSART